jgi:hypothetical protein
LIQIGNGGNLPGSRTTAPIDLFFIRATGAPTTLDTQASIGDYDIDVISATGFSAGTYMGIFCPTANRFFFTTVLNVVSNTLTLDTPLDFAFIPGDNVLPLTRDLNVDGSTTPVVFQIRGGGAGSTLSIDINRLMFSMDTTTRVTLQDFGDLTALTNGLVLQRSDGITRNTFNIKQNSDFVSLAYDLQMFDATNPNENNGLACRYTFNGQDKHGTALQLEPGDSLDLIIQDDLSGLEKFHIMGQGYESELTQSPEFIDIAAGDTMTPVGINKTRGTIYLMEQPRKYLQYWCKTGDPAPTDQSNGVEIERPGLEIKSSSGIDVYIGVAGTTLSGRVRADL